MKKENLKNLNFGNVMVLYYSELFDGVICEIKLEGNNFILTTEGLYPERIFLDLKEFCKELKEGNLRFFKEINFSKFIIETNNEE